MKLVKKQRQQVYPFYVGLIPKQHLGNSYRKLPEFLFLNSFQETTDWRSTRTITRYNEFVFKKKIMKTPFFKFYYEGLKNRFTTSYDERY